MIGRWTGGERILPRVWCSGCNSLRVSWLLMDIYP
jgi:hypothetical protein